MSAKSSVTFKIPLFPYKALNGQASSNLINTLKRSLCSESAGFILLHRVVRREQEVNLPFCWMCSQFGFRGKTLSLFSKLDIKPFFLMKLFCRAGWCDPSPSLRYLTWTFLFLTWGAEGLASPTCPALIINSYRTFCWSLLMGSVQHHESVNGYYLPFYDNHIFCYWW